MRVLPQLGFRKEIHEVLVANSRTSPPSDRKARLVSASLAGDSHRVLRPPSGGIFFYRVIYFRSPQILTFPTGSACQAWKRDQGAGSSSLLLTWHRCCYFRSPSSRRCRPRQTSFRCGSSTSPSRTGLETRRIALCTRRAESRSRTYQ